LEDNLYFSRAGLLVRMDIRFALLEKFDSGRRLPPPPVSKVFRLYCIEDLSAAEVAR
jgi:hypothetical protein